MSESQDQVQQIEWQSGEWCDDGEIGYEAELNHYVAQVYESEEGLGYFWRVDSTSAISEWPEVINCGHAPSVDEAKSLAEACLLRQRVRKLIDYGSLDYSAREW